MRRALRAALAVIILAVLLAPAGCGYQDSAEEVDLSDRRPVDLADRPDAITYAYLPQYAHTVSYQRHHPLVRYLSETTGLAIRQVFPGSFDDHIRMVGQGKIDISFSNPFTYVKLADIHGARAFARIVEDRGEQNFRGQVICRSDDSRIRSIQDCKGKRWIAVDPASAGGYLYPLGLFRRHGIRRGDFKEIAFAVGPGGQQEKVILAVLAGQYDIGTVREGALDILAGQVDLTRIRVVAYTDWYPGWVYAAARDLDPAVTEAVKKAMLALSWDNPEHRAILQAAHFSGILAATDQDFAPVRDIVRALDF